VPICRSLYSPARKALVSSAGALSVTGQSPQAALPLLCPAAWPIGASVQAPDTLLPPMAVWRRKNPFRAGSTALEEDVGNGQMKGDQIMKRFTKIAFGALLLAGATTAVAVPASARVFVGVGAPYAYAPGPVCNPYSPYYCGYGPAYVGAPVFGLGFGGGWGGGWHGGGFHGGGHR
jgi:hypothetical protein